MVLHKRFAPTAMVVGMFAAALATANAQATSGTGVMHFTFRDSTRGTVVRPQAILLDGEMTYPTITEAGRTSLPAAPGDHRILVKATGYTDLDSRQTALAEHAPMNLLMLDPEKKPEQLEDANLRQDMPADGTVIAGFVSDDISGKPIQGATVELLKTTDSVKTDENGFFKLPVHIKEGKQMPEDPRGVIYGTCGFKVTMPGYGFEERVNSLIESGTPKVYQVTLVRGGGGNSIDEDEGRNNLQSSLFGRNNVEPEDVPTTPSAPEDRVQNHNHAHEN